MDRGDGTRVASSVEEVETIAQHLAVQLDSSTIICFFGDLGTGKTTFVKALAAALGAQVPVNSPTFQYLNIYSGKIPVYHFDLYRLKSSEEFFLLGFDEFFGKGVVCIEWAERIGDSIPENAIRIFLSHEGGNSRTIKIVV